ncbi:MAG: hypothetical protein IJC67_00760 [Clostridia bacterium]|nr:hypothetical protein [Clostridia bacterium]
MHKRYTALITALVILLIGIFALGCGNQAPEVDPMEGFRTGVHGGGTLQEGINARSIRVENEGEDVRITFDFIAGSRMSGGTEETELSELPAYRVYIEESPCRLVVELESLAYWDYTYDPAIENEHLHGFFRRNLSDSEQVTFYFQLKEDMAYTIEDHGGSLSILLRSVPGQESLKNTVHYYAMTDTYREYCSGIISREYDVSPVLCRNFEDIVLISPAYETQAEAEAFLNAAIASSTDLKPEQWEIIALYHNDLPIYDENFGMKVVDAQQAARVNGEAVNLPVLLHDGIYLATAADGSILYSKTIREGDAGSEVEYEELWTLHQDGSTRRMLRFEFAAIEACSYSPDGHKLAVLERAGEGSHLYIFDTDTNDLMADLSEMGFGDMISAFTWNELGNILYAVSGSAGLQVNQYDFTVSEETKRYNVVDRNGADEGSIGFYGGEVYFTQSSMEEGAIIYSIKPEGGVRKAFTEGGAFAFSPDRRYLALTTTGMDTVVGETAVKDAFSLMDLESGKTTLITDAYAVHEFFWSQDGSRLFYFENRLTGSESEATTEGDPLLESEVTEEAPVEEVVTEENIDEGLAEEPETETEQSDPYPYALYMYDVATGESRLVAELSSTAVFPGAKADVLYIPYYDQETMGALVRATYEFTIEESEVSNGKESE